MNLKYFTLIAMLIVGAVSREIPSNTIDDSSFENNIPVDTIKTIVLCSNDGGLTGVMNCAVSRALKMLQVASKIKNLEILPGVVIEGDEIADRNGKEINEETLPNDPVEKSSKLTEMFMDKFVRLVSGRTLKINFPKTTAENIARALEEGRGKMKKMMGPLLMAIGVKLMAIIPIFLGGLAILSSKALIIAKIALVLSAIIFAQSAFSSGFRNIVRGGGNGFGLGNKFNPGIYGNYGPDYNYGPPGWTTTQLGSQYPYKRSIEVSQTPNDDELTAQDLAYSQQKP